MGVGGHRAHVPGQRPVLDSAMTATRPRFHRKSTDVASEGSLLVSQGTYHPLIRNKLQAELHSELQCSYRRVIKAGGREPTRQTQVMQGLSVMLGMCSTSPSLSQLASVPGGDGDKETGLKAGES